MSNTCIFTIVSRNYLHYARTLLASVKAHYPEADLVVGLCDRRGETDFSDDIFSLIELEELEIPEREKFIFRYTILEINTAIKPYVIGKLFDRGYEKVIYFDPDIKVFQPLNELVGLLDEHQMLLTPHLSNLLDDGKAPNELAILVSGSYNLGFVALRNTPAMQKFVTWWQSKLYADCVVDLPRGLFVDQKWMDLAPGMFDGVYINRDESWNVAYWNLNHRVVKQVSNGYEVNGRPLTFFHFSGFAADDENLSKHQNRFTRTSAGPAVKALCEDYAKCLVENGMREVISIPYHFNFFPNGTPIPDLARYVFREDYDWENCTKNFWTQAGAAEFMGYLNEPIELNGKTMPAITRLAYKLYTLRPDLQEAFPDLGGVFGRRYADWFIHTAEEQVKIPACFIEPVEQALGYTRQGKSVAVTEDAASSGQLKKSMTSDFYARVYRLAWRYRHLVRPFLSDDFRHNTHVKLVNKVSGNEPVVAVSEPEILETFDTDPGLEEEIEVPDLGINVFGYTSAESGIGQSVRSSINGLVKAGVALAVTDFRAGNVSRMNESIDSELYADAVYPINLFHINADQLLDAKANIGDAQFDGHYNIGYWAWELPEFPDRWLEAIEALDEIWVPSTFCQQSIAGKAAIPVLVMPHSVFEPFVDPAFDRAYFDLPADDVVFLTMFDALSVPERKNPFAAIAAFRAMPGDTACKLVVKVSNLDKTPEFATRLKEVIGESDDVIVIDRYLEKAEIFGLLNVSDSFVSLHRSEGFGLGIAEAMALGRPVIATGWSGNTDFMNCFNSILVDYTLRELEECYGPYDAGCYWAEPNLASAVQAMNLVATRSDMVKRLGENARLSIREANSPAVTGATMGRRIEYLTNLLNSKSSPSA